MSQELDDQTTTEGGRDLSLPLWPTTTSSSIPRRSLPMPLRVGVDSRHPLPQIEAHRPWSAPNAHLHINKTVAKGVREDWLRPTRYLRQDVEL
jgi:hypothetical protein